MGFARYINADFCSNVVDEVIVHRGIHSRDRYIALFPFLIFVLLSSYTYIFAISRANRVFRSRTLEGEQIIISMNNGPLFTSARKSTQVSQRRYMLRNREFLPSGLLDVPRINCKRAVYRDNKRQFIYDSVPMSYPSLEQLGKRVTLSGRMPGFFILHHRKPSQQS